MGSITTNYPTGLDTDGDLPAKSSGNVIPSADWNRITDAIQALQAKAGINGSAVSTSHDKLIRELGYNVKAYGAVGDGSTNDRAAVIAAIAAAPDGGTVYFPDGVYSISTIITVTSRNSLRFAGERGAKLKRESVSGTGIFKFVTCSDLEITGLEFDANGSTTFNPCVEMQEIDGCQVHHNRFVNTGSPAATGDDRYAFLTNTVGTSPANSDVWFTDNYVQDLQCEFDNVERWYVERNTSIDNVDSAAFGSFLINSTGQTVRDGLIAHNIIIDGDEVAIPLVNDPGDTTSAVMERVTVRDNLIYRTAQLTVPIIRVGTVNAAAVATTNTFRDIRIEGNEIILLNGAVSTAEIIHFNSSTTSTITLDHCAINRNRVISLGAGGGRGIRTQRLQSSECIGNVVMGTTDGYYWQSTSGSALQADNVFSDNIARNVSGVAFTYQNSTGGNRVRRNEAIGTAPTTLWTTSTVHATDIIERPPLVGSKTYDPASIADGDDLSTTVTVTGAAVGDVAVASFSTIGANDVLISANVSSANTVTVVLLNRRGSAYDIASGTLRVVVWPFV